MVEHEANFGGGGSVGEVEEPLDGRGCGPSHRKRSDPHGGLRKAGVGDGDGEENRRKIYANLLVEAVRRQTLLPSDLLERKLRFERDDALTRVPGTTKALFSSRPLEIVMNTKIFAAINFFAAMWIGFMAVDRLTFKDQRLSFGLFRSKCHMVHFNPVSANSSLEFVLRVKSDDVDCSRDATGGISGFGIHAAWDSGMSECMMDGLPVMHRDETDCRVMSLKYDQGTEPPTLCSFFVIPSTNRSLSFDFGFKDTLSSDVDLLFRDAVAAPGPPGRMEKYDTSIVWMPYFAELMAWTFSFAIFAGLVILKLTNMICYTTSHSFLCLMLASASNLIGSIGYAMRLDNVYEYNYHDYARATSMHAYLSVAFFLSALWLFWVPRFPDLLLVFTCSSILSIWSQHGKWDFFYIVCMAIPMCGGLAIFALRVKILVEAKMRIRESRKEFDHAWGVFTSSSREIASDLLRLDSVVRAAESSIPPGMVARQCNMGAPSNRTVKKYFNLVLAGGGGAQTNLSFGQDSSFFQAQSQRTFGQRTFDTHRSRRTSIGSARSTFLELDNIDTNANSDIVNALVGGRATGAGAGGSAFMGHQSGDRAMFSKTSSFQSVRSSRTWQSATMDAAANVANKIMLNTWKKKGFEQVMVVASNPAVRLIRDTRRPIKTLDQLWTQALLLRGFLLPKVLRLAHAHNGCFPVRGQRAGLYGRSKSSDWFSYKGSLKLGGIKNPKRGIEKVDTAYGGDVSRLLDVCRETIVFDRVSDMADCLNELHRDPEVVFVRIKSNMTRAGADPHVDLGFRLITLNLFIKSEDTQRLAVDGHICELRLILRKMAVLMTPKRHKDYIRYRNIVSAFDMNPVHTLTVNVQRYTRIAANFVTGVSGKVSAVIFRRNSVAGFLPGEGSPLANGGDFHAYGRNSPAGRRPSHSSRPSNFANSPIIQSKVGSSPQLESRRTLRAPSIHGSNGSLGGGGSSFLGGERPSEGVGESATGANGNWAPSRSLFGRRRSSLGSEWGEHDIEDQRERRMSATNTARFQNAAGSKPFASSIDYPSEMSRQNSGSGFLIDRAGGHSTVMFESLPSPRKPQDTPINTSSTLKRSDTEATEIDAGKQEEGEDRARSSDGPASATSPRQSTTRKSRLSASPTRRETTVQGGKLPSRSASPQRGGALSHRHGRSGQQASSNGRLDHAVSSEVPSDEQASSNELMRLRPVSNTSSRSRSGRGGDASLPPVGQWMEWEEVEVPAVAQGSRDVKTAAEKAAEVAVSWGDKKEEGHVALFNDNDDSASNAHRDVPHDSVPRSFSRSSSSSSMIRRNDSDDEEPRKWESTWGVDLNKEDIEKLEGVCRLGALGFTMVMDRTLDDTIQSQGLGRASGASMLYTSTPMAASTSRWMQFLVTLIGLGFIIQGVPNMLATSSGDGNSGVLQSWRHFKFLNLADRRGVPNPATPGFTRFQVLNKFEGGCGLRVSALSFCRGGTLPPSISLPVVVNANATVCGRPRHEDENIRVDRQVGSQITVSYERPVPFNGWLLSNPQGGADSSNFAVYASNYSAAEAGDVPDEEWALVGAPAWSFPKQWIHFLGSEGVTSSKNPAKIGIFDMLTDTDARYNFAEESQTILFEPGLPLKFNSLPPANAGMGVGLILFAFLGAIGQPSLAPHGVACGAAIACLLAFFETGHDRISLGMDTTVSGVQLMVILAMYSCLIVVVYVEKRRLVWLLIASLLSVVNTAIRIAVVMSSNIGPRYPFGLLYPFEACIIWLSIGVAYLSRLFANYQANKLVEEDIRMYDALWKSEVEQDTGHLSIEHLSKVVKMLGLDAFEAADKKKGIDMLHQKNRKFLVLNGKGSQGVLRLRLKKTDIAPRLTREKVLGEDIIFDKLNCMSVPHSLDPNSIVRSYDQLFVQAILLHSIAVNKVKEWAIKSNAYVPSVNSGFRGVNDASSTTELGVPQASEASKESFIKWVDAAGNPELAGAVKWPTLKKHQRGIEKLARGYKGDVSRLVDITRFSLFFDSFADLTQALGVIVTDFDIKVERLKSRMRLDFDSKQTAGYRDVMLNMRVCTKETAMLGIDAHICELQLVLRSFGELKTAQGHTRYVMWRDLRAL